MPSGVYDNGSTSASYIKPRLSWSSVQDVAQNKSTVTVTLYAKNTASGTGYVSGTGSWNIMIGDAWSGSMSATVKVQAGQDWVKIVSWTRTVTHDSDGTKKIKIQATGGISSSSVWSSTKTGVEIDLGKIVKSASTATCTSSVAINGTNKSTVTITASASGLYHKVTWRFSSYSYTASGVSATASYALPTTWLSGLPTAVSGTAYVDVKTYGEQACTTQIGSTYTVSFTVTVPSNLVPTVQSGWATAAPVNENALVPSGVYVAGYSQVQVTFNTANVTAPAGTTIDKYQITYAGKTYASPYKTPVVDSPGNAVITATVVDKRGRSTSTTITAAFLAYTQPTLTDVQAFRCAANGTPSEVGTHVSAIATANVASLSGANTYTLQAFLKEAGGDYGSAHAMTSGTALILDGLDIETNYYVLVKVSDTMDNSAQIETLIEAGISDTPGGGPSFKGMWLREGGDGAGFGCEPEEGWLQVQYTKGLQLKRGKLKIGDTEISEAQLQALINLL